MDKHTTLDTLINLIERGEPVNTRDAVAELRALRAKLDEVGQGGFGTANTDTDTARFRGRVLTPGESEKLRERLDGVTKKKKFDALFEGVGDYMVLTEKINKRIVPTDVVWRTVGAAEEGARTLATCSGGAEATARGYHPELFALVAAQDRVEAALAATDKHLAKGYEASAATDWTLVLSVGIGIAVVVAALGGAWWYFNQQPQQQR